MSNIKNKEEFFESENEVKIEKVKHAGAVNTCSIFISWIKDNDLSLKMYYS